MGAGRGQPGRPARRRARAVFGAWPERRRHSNTAGWLPGRAAVRPAPVAVLHQEPTALASAPAAPARPPAHYRQAMHADFGLDGQGTLRVWLFTDVSNVRRARVGLERDLGWTSARAGRTGLPVGERRRHAATPPLPPSTHFPSPDRRRTQAVWPVARHQARAGGPARRQRCRREWWGRARAEVKAAPACSTPARLPHPQPPLPPTYQPCRRPS